jgi:hypothetical protein
MIIVDPVTLGDVACTRASSKWVFDRSGTMVQVPANALAVTYDPSDLTKAPYALVEPAATNLAVQSEVMSAWQSSAATVQTDIGYAPNGTLTIDRITGSAAVSGLYRFITLNPGEVSCASIFVKWESGDTLLRFGSDQGGTALYAVFDVSAGTVSSLGSGIVAAGVIRCNTPYGIFYRLWVAFAAPLASTPFILYSAAAAMTLQAWGFQVEPGKSPTSYIATTAAGPVTRAGDVIGAGSGLVYSNVAITEPTYSTATTYAKDDKVYDPVTHNVFQSLIAGNVNKALADTTAWTPRGAVNRWAMLDQYNNTQTANADEILLVLSPQAISQGLYLGNLFADEVRVSVVDSIEGLVYSETKSLVESNSGASFFNWGFKRIRRKDYFLTLKLPTYANALVTISLRKVGGTAKCGMCTVGPVDDFGPTLAGLSTEGKDYSSTTFNFDGTSSTVIRPYAKRVTCDVMVSNDQVDYLQARLFERRQQPLVWVGGPYGSTAVYGRYGSFKNVFQYPAHSLMNLTIEGAV